MANLDGYDANVHEPMGDFTPLPKGEYRAIAVESEMKATKAGTGQYLQIEWQVVAGDYNERKLWSRLNLDNPNEKAVEIAQRELSSICRAVGVMKPKNSEELHDKPLLLSVDVEERNDKPGEFSNRIKGYDAIEGKSGVKKPAKKPNGGAKAMPWAK